VTAATAGVASRAAWFTGPGAVELRGETIPPPGPGEVLLRIRATAICTLEQRIWRGVVSIYPVSPGHEPAAEVVAVGPGVTSAAPGDHVIVSFLPRCGQCFYCRLGESDKCTTRPARLHPDGVRFGGLAEYTLAQATGVFRIDPELPWAQAALGEPLACVVHSVKAARLGFGEDVVVVGAGTMGQLHVLLATRRACRVIVSEPDPAKREVARRHGAAITLDPTTSDVPEAIAELTGGRGADALFLTTGGEAGRDLLPGLRKGGRAVFYTSYYPPVDWPMSPDWIHNAQVALVGSVNQTAADWQDAANLLSKGLIDVSGLVAGRYPIDDLAAAMDRASAGDTFRVIVEPASAG
jgi:L-iditol 2-dehydrogenase